MSHHARNTSLLATVETGWGMAMAFLQEDSIIPVILSSFHPDYAVLALVPAIARFSMFPFELLSPYAFERLPRKRFAVYALHLLIPLVWLGMGAWLALARPEAGPRSLLIFSSLYVTTYALTGLLSPLWYDYMGKIVDPMRRGRAFSTIFAVQSLAGVGGGILAQRFFVARGSQDPTSYAACFLAAAVAAGIASQAFLATKEEGVMPTTRPRVKEYLTGILHLIRSDRALARYLLVRAMTRLSIVVTAYYAVQALAIFPLAPVALFGTAVIAGKLATFLFSWRWSDSWGMKPFLVAGVLALASASALAAWLGSRSSPGLGLAPYFVVASLVGIFQASDGAAHATFVIGLAPEQKRASYMIAVNTTLYPWFLLATFIAGKVADARGPALVQGVCAALFLFAGLYLAFAVKERRTAAPIA